MRTNYLDQYIVPISGLDDDKEYNYDFVIDSCFFQNFEKSEIKGGDIKVKVQLLKKSTSLKFKFNLKGNVIITCDKCLDDYYQNIDFEDSILVIPGEETNFDTNEDFVTLEYNSNEINISQFIYEFAHFALPFVHYHPLDNNNNPTCNPEMIEILNNHTITEEDYSEGIIDARWEKLIEIKNNIK